MVSRESDRYRIAALIVRFCAVRIKLLENYSSFQYFQSIYPEKALKLCLMIHHDREGLADYLKIAEKTASRFTFEGKVPGFKVGSAWRFRKSEIDRWISEQEQKGEDKSDGD